MNITNLSLLPSNCPLLGNTTGPLETYTLVQEVNEVYTDGVRCELIQSKFTYVCTNTLVASHQRLATVPEIEIPIPISIAKCHKMSKQMLYLGPDHNHYKLKLDQVSVFTFHTQGQQEVSKHTVICEGDQVKLGDQLIDGVLVLEQIKVRISKRRFRLRKGKIEVKEDHKSLSCTLYQNGCSLGDHTYVFDAPNSTKYERIQTITAQEITNWKGGDFLVSHEHKIRLVPGEKFVDQGISFQRTNYPRILLIKGRITHFQNLTSNHFQLQDWVESRDDYITYILEYKLLQVTDYQLHHQCNYMQALLHSQVVIAARDSSGGIYIPFGNGTFGLPMGETVYQFSCKEVQVYPNTIQTCTREIPVTFRNSSWFLEPLSRVLVKHPTFLPCSPSMPAKFQSKNGEWISAVPEIINTTAPHLVSQHLQPFLQHESMDHGGLYSDDQMNEFANLLTLPKLTLAIKDNIIRTICKENPHNLCNQYRTTFQLPSNPEPDFYRPIINLKIYLINLLHDFGEISAIFLSIYIILRTIITIIGTLFNCFVLRETPMIRRVVQPCCTTCLINQDYGIRAQQRQAALSQAQQLEKAVISGEAVINTVSEKRGLKRNIDCIS